MYAKHMAAFAAKSGAIVEDTQMALANSGGEISESVGDELMAKIDMFRFKFRRAYFADALAIAPNDTAALVLFNGECAKGCFEDIVCANIGKARTLVRQVMERSAA